MPFEMQILKLLTFLFLELFSTALSCYWCTRDVEGTWREKVFLYDYSNNSQGGK